jgi:hypothetical protein
MDGHIPAMYQVRGRREDTGGSRQVKKGWLHKVRLFPGLPCGFRFLSSIRVNCGHGIWLLGIVLPPELCELDRPQRTSHAGCDRG